jgi:uncharacterized membrane protein YkvA (DUF1232 family)
MKIKQLLTLIEETGLSPEDIAELIGVSGMTVRRWQQKPIETELAPLYADGTRKAIFELLLNGRLKNSSVSVEWAFSSSDPLSQRAALASLGFPTQTTDMAAWDSDRLLESVSQLGATEQNAAYVESNSEKILSFSRFGEAWREIIGHLRGALVSPKLKQSEKWIAIGALCYLLMPFDLIPDSLPVVGYLDDFAILSIAARHYQKLMSAVGA